MGHSSPLALLILAVVTRSVTVSSQDITFMQQPKDTNAVVGSNVFFPCTYTGTRGVPQWKIQNDTHVVSQLPLQHSYNGTGLIVHKVNMSMNATEYRCCFKIHTGRGIFKETCSSSGKLTISAGFTVHPAPVQTAPGERGRFQCTAVASSVCNIQWRINRTLIIDSEADAYSIPARTEDGMLSSTLYVLAVPQHNNSEVECCAYSDTGVEEICTNPVNLAISGVQSIPGPPTFSLLSFASSESFGIEIQLSPEGIPPILSIAVNFTSHAGLVQSIPGPFSPGEFVTASLRGLKEQTEYRFRLFAVNFNGVSPASDETNLWTGESQTCDMDCGTGIGVFFALVMVWMVFMNILGYCTFRCRKRVGKHKDQGNETWKSKGLMEKEEGDEGEKTGGMEKVNREGEQEKMDFQVYYKVTTV